MSCSELQSEELEVLKSIYEGDDAYSAIEDTVHQYKVRTVWRCEGLIIKSFLPYLLFFSSTQFGDDGSGRSFVLELRWSSEYPENEAAEVSLEAFYNRHIGSEVKTRIEDAGKAEAEQVHFRVCLIR